MNRTMYYVLSLILIIAAIVGGGWFSLVATQRDFTELESVILQFLILTIGLGGTFIAGRQFGQDTFRAYARDRYRRLLSLQSVTFDTFSSLKMLQHSGTTTDYDRSVIAEVIGQNRSMLYVAHDCLKSWYDIAPDEVGDLHKEFFRKKEQEGK